MNKLVSWGLIGFGNIGRELCRQLAQPDVAVRTGLRSEPDFTLRSSSNKSLAEIKNLPDVVFVAIPSTEDGKQAYEYISLLLKAGKLVVTAEKGALANNFAALKKESDNFRRLGVEAAVGGGTRLVTELAGYCRDIANISQLHLVLNGTLTVIFSSLNAGQSLEQAIQKAVKAGYAEPGHQNPRDVIRSEAEGDIPKKTAILFNRLGLSDKILGWRQLSFKLTDNEISRAVKGAKTRRFIVLFYPAGNRAKDDIIGGFRLRHDGWLITGGFQDVGKNSLLRPLRELTGPGSGFVIGLGPNETDGVYSLTGPGAGARPTVNTMLDDYLNLCYNNSTIN